MMKKFLAFILALSFSASLFLAGCASPEVLSYEPTEVPEQQETAAPPEEPSEAISYKAASEAYAPDEVVMTVNGLEVTWSEYFYWMVTTVGYIEENFGPITDWRAICVLDSVQNNSEFVKNYALESIIPYRALEYNAIQAGASLSDEDYKTLEELWLSDVETYGGGDEAAFMEFLSGLYATRELINYMNEISLLYHNCFTELYGETGELCSDEQTEGFAEANKYYATKHILIPTVDAEGTAYPEEELAARLELAEDIYARLEAAEDLDAMFDELMNEYSEDPGLLYYPDGYIFTSGEAVSEYEEAALALGDGEISGVVESAHGYHIIRRIPLNLDGVVEYISAEEQYSLRYVAATNLFSATVDNWVEESRDDVLWMGGFEELDLSVLFSR